MSSAGMSGPFIRRPVATTLLMAGLLLVGVMAFTQLPIAALPQVVLEGQDVDVIKGQIAQKGIARGRVKIVKNRQQASEIQEGEILVSPMTQPDFIDAMYKAGAIITDEGGIVCHAAVIAREMKKPCVIGTKIATQVFKDGDMVEVDADNGIVRKI